MPVPTNLSDLSQTPASNSPASTDTLSTADDYLRAQASILAKISAGTNALVTPALGTPASGVLTNCTGTASGLTAGNIAAGATLPAHVLGGNVTSTGNPSLNLGTGALTAGAGTFSGDLLLGPGTSNYSLSAYKAGATAAYLQVGNGNTGSAAANGLLVGVDSTGLGVLKMQGAFDLALYAQGAERARATSTGLAVTGTITSSGSPSFNTNIGYIGVAGSGTGGNWRYKDDSGTTRWLTGFLGTGGATNWSVYDIVNAKEVLQIAPNAAAVTMGSTGLSVTGALSATGNVAVNTASAVSLGTNVATVDIANTAGGGIRFRTSGAGNSGYLQAVASGIDLGTTDALPIRFITNSATQATLDASGNLLVGAASGYANKINSIQTGGAASFAYLAHNTATSGDNSFISFGTEASYTGRGSIDYNRAGGLTRYNTTSDGTLKNILGDADLSKSVALLSATRIREYSWKDDQTNKTQIGVIAQEVHAAGFEGAVSVGGDYEETVPAVTEQQLVTPAVLDDEGNEVTPAVYETVTITPEHTVTKYRPWGVDKTAWTFHLVAGFQAQQKLIAQLEARIAALESQP